MNISYRIKKILFFSFIFTVFLLNLTSDSVFAINLPFISKAKIRVSIPPGEKDHGDIMVENPTDQVRAMRLYLEDWYYTPLANGAKEFLPANTHSRSCASWISFSPAEFLIGPFGKQRVSYSIEVPKDAQGGYFAALFFETMVAETPGLEKQRGAGINLAARIASLFYVEAEGTVKRTATVDNLKVTNERTNANKLLIELDFKNTGNVDITAGGTFHIMDKHGTVYARGEFKPVYTFLNDEAKLQAVWSQPIPTGTYDLVLTLDLGKALEEAGLGRGPVITKEAKIEIKQKGEAVKVFGFR